jgi:hypothetical protein
MKSFGEVCVVRFVAMGAPRLVKHVRKAMPAKFNGYSIIYNPLLYFDAWPKFELMMLDTEKLNSAVCLVARAESPKNLVEKVYGHVQSLFMSVVVGKTTLQKGGSFTPQQIDAIVLYALIQGGFAKNHVGECWKRAKMQSGFLGKIWDAIHTFVKTQLNDAFPRLIHFFRASRAQKYVESRVDLADLHDYNEYDISSIRHTLSKLTSVAKEWKEVALLEKWSLAEIASRGLTIFDDLKEEERSRRAIAAYEQMYANDLKVDLTSDALVAQTERKRVLNETLEALKAELVVAEARLDLELETGESDEGSTLGEELSVLERTVSFVDAVVDEVAVVASDAESCASSGFRFGVDLFSRKRGAKRPKKVVSSKKGEAKVVCASSGRKPGEGLMHDRVPVVENEPLASRVLKDKRVFSALDYDMALRDVDNFPVVSERSEAAFLFNRRRLDERKRLVMLSKGQIKKLVEKYTIKGKVAKCVVTEAEALQCFENAGDNYKIDLGVEVHEVLARLQTSMKDLCKKAKEGGYAKFVPERDVEVINGYAGSGKTRHIVERFEEHKCVYIAPLMGVMNDTRKSIMRKFKEEYNLTLDPITKTMDKLAEVPAEGDLMFIDEASLLSFDYLVTVLALYNYKRFVIVGDIEQTKFFDTKGFMTPRCFADLVPREAVTTFAFTFRYGPSLAAMLNSVWGYPVVSLRNEDTKVGFYNIDSFGSNVKGSALTVSGKTVTEFNEVCAIKTVKASQGQTFKRVNALLREGDASAALRFRENGVVLASRATHEIDFYMEYESKNSKAVSRIHQFADNYATMFNIVLPSLVNDQDF